MEQLTGEQTYVEHTPGGVPTKWCTSVALASKSPPEASKGTKCGSFDGDILYRRDIS